jgi:hypothetical protein
MDVVTTERWRKIVERAVENAEQGCAKSRRWVADRLLGRELVAMQMTLVETETAARLDYYSCLSRDEFRRYKELWCALKIRDLTPPEAVEYAAFTHRLASSAGGAGDDGTPPPKFGRAGVPYGNGNGHGNGHGARDPG